MRPAVRTLTFVRRRVAAFALCIVYAVLATVVVVRPLPALATVCSTSPGKDGSPGTLSGTYNTYYQPPAGTLSSGSTAVPLGAIDTGGGGASTAVAAGDLLLIIQMQDGTFTYSNGSVYGDGSGSGSGYATLGQAGLYEYVAVQSVSGGTAAIQGTGAGNGLINTYVESAATSTHGQQTYQIVRVPQYINAQLSNTFHAAYWDGKTGGVAALDIASTLNLGGASIYATGDGFRGGGLTKATSTPTAILNSDWAASATMNAGAPGHGSKGEGVLGSPDYLFEYTNFTTPSAPSAPTVITSGANGYPGGDQARGAPGDAGGGGTDMDPFKNDQNSGGGGGGNGGAGGKGGYPWTPSYSGSTPQYSQSGVHTAPGTGYSSSNSGDVGGRGGSAVTPSVTRIFLGGGGGAGSNNDGTNNNSFGADGSSGGVGGGIVMMRIANTSGSAATIYANGTTGLAPDNDGGGGGGAGGSVVITSPNTFTGINVNVDGAAGTTAAATTSDTAVTIQHGPGGGGGGGVVLTSSPVTASAAAGPNGTTTTSSTSYGATPGSSGLVQTVSAGSIPGVASGAECYTSGSAGSLTLGPVGANAATGSYDGSVPATNNNDFTAKGFFPAGAQLANTGTVPGSWIGSTISQGPTTVQVLNEFSYTKGGSPANLTFTATAPTSPAGWTVRICANVSGAPSCATGGAWTAIGSAGATSSSTYHLGGSGGTTTDSFFAVYTAPAGLTAFARYDAPIYADDGGGNTNWTHDELYPGYVVLTKQVQVQSSGCGGTVPAGTACPGGVMLYTIDYRDIMAGGSSEKTVTGAFPTVSGGSFVITEDGTSTWGTTSSGLKEALVAGANCTTTFGDTTAASTFTTAAAGSKSFTVTVGGASGTLVPNGLPGIYQGTICFRVTVK